MQLAISQRGMWPVPLGGADQAKHWAEGSSSIPSRSPGTKAAAGKAACLLRSDVGQQRTQEEEVGWQEERRPSIVPYGEGNTCPVHPSCLPGS